MPKTCPHCGHALPDDEPLGPLPKRRQTGLTAALLHLDVGGSIRSHSRIESVHRVIAHVKSKHPARVYETRILSNGIGIWRTA
jgi:hypothetical protein